MIKRLAEYFGLREELLEELDLDIHEDYGSSGDMLYSFYFVVPSYISKDAIQETGWEPDQVIRFPASVMAHDFDETEWEEADEEEWAWVRRTPQEERFDQLSQDLHHLVWRSDNTDFAKNQIDYRILYAYGITLFESFLTETAKHLIVNSDHAIRNSAKFFSREDTAKKFSLLEIMDLDAPKYILGLVGNILFHNTKVATRFFSMLLGAEINFSNLEKIVKQRHDIIHRNGKTRDGEVITLSSAEVKAALREIEKASEKLQKLVLKAESNKK